MDLLADLAAVAKRGAAIAVALPSHLESVTIVVEQKVKAEAEALAHAVTPEVESDIKTMVSFLEAHVGGLSALTKAHAALAAAEKDVVSEIAAMVHPDAAPATPAEGSDAVPTTPVF